MSQLASLAASSSDFVGARDIFNTPEIEFCIMFDQLSGIRNKRYVITGRLTRRSACGIYNNQLTLQRRKLHHGSLLLTEKDTWSKGKLHDTSLAFMNIVQLKQGQVRDPWRIKKLISIVWLHKRRPINRGEGNTNLHVDIILYPNKIATTHNMKTKYGREEKIHWRKRIWAVSKISWLQWVSTVGWIRQMYDTI